MTKKKVETEETPSTLDRLTELRKDIVGDSAVTHLIDILIDHHDGDSEAVRQEIADALEEKVVEQGTEKGTNDQPGG